jgi:hypothetical protein
VKGLFAVPVIDITEPADAGVEDPSETPCPWIVIYERLIVPDVVSMTKFPGGIMSFVPVVARAAAALTKAFRLFVAPSPTPPKSIILTV